MRVVGLTSSRPDRRNELLLTRPFWDRVRQLIRGSPGRRSHRSVLDPSTRHMPLLSNVTAMLGTELQDDRRLRDVTPRSLTRIFLLTVPEELLRIERDEGATGTVPQRHPLLRRHVQFRRTSRRGLSMDFSPLTLPLGFGYLSRGDKSKNIRGLQRTSPAAPPGSPEDPAYRCLVP